MHTKKRKAQASFEFFMNYAWIVLVTTVVMAVLVYYNENFSLYSLNEECSIFDQFDCLGSSWMDQNELRISLRNIGQANILVSNITITKSGDYKPIFVFNSSLGSCITLNGSSCLTQDDKVVLPQGSKLIFTLFNTTPVYEKNLKGSILVNYYFNNSNTVHFTKGLITVSRQE